MSEKAQENHPHRNLDGPCKCRLCHRRVGLTPPVERERLREERVLVKVAELDYPEFTRASGQCICSICGREYWRHPHDFRWLDWIEVPYLRKLCDGTLVKL